MLKTRINEKDTENPGERVTMRVGRHFTEKPIHRAGIHMKRCSLSLVVMEMQMKTTVSYHFMPFLSAKIKFEDAEY